MKCSFIAPLIYAILKFIVSGFLHENSFNLPFWIVFIFGWFYNIISQTKSLNLVKDTLKALFW